MDGFRADLPALEDLVRRMSQFEEHAEAVTDDLDRQVARLHAQWSGVASGEHLAAHRRWRTGEQQMRAALAQLRDAVRTAHANYDSAIAAGAAMWT